jgi:hypothetical protein
LIKIKCFSFHKHNHYASYCLDKKKGKGEQQQNQVATSIETQMNDFVIEFKKDLSLVSFLSTNMIPRNAWYADSGTYWPMTSSHKLFSSLKKQDSRVQVYLGDDVKYLVARVGSIPFQLESGNYLNFEDVLFVPRLRKNLLSISVMEDEVFAVEFKNQQVLIRIKDSSPNAS